MPLKFSISFGLVYIPVTLTNCVKKKDIGFNLLDKRTGTRIKYKKTAGESGEVNASDIVKGYEYEKGRYVVFEEEELAAIKKQKDKNIVIEKFVSVSEIDPIYFDKPYYVKPAGAEKAFALLKRALEQSGMAGIAHAMTGERETLMALRVAGGNLIANTMHFHDEIVIVPDNVSVQAGEKELAMAAAIIESMKDEFKAEEYRNEYRLRLEDAISKKIEGKEIVTEQRNDEKKIIDLMEALQKSLMLTGNKENKKSLNTPKTSKTAPKAAQKPKTVKKSGSA